MLGVSIQYPCFPIGRSGNSNLGFSDKFFFSESGLSACRPTPNLEDQGLLLVWPLPFNQSGMVRPARNQKSPPAQLSGSLRHTSSTTTTRCQPKVKKKKKHCVLCFPYRCFQLPMGQLCFVLLWVNDTHLISPC